jgi:hypothetical protein
MPISVVPPQREVGVPPLVMVVPGGAMLRHDYGPWRVEDADRLLAEYGLGKSG